MICRFRFCCRTRIRTWMVLGDAWEFQWFGSLQATAGEDADGDGSSNAVEEALGLDPTSGEESFRCEVVVGRRCGVAGGGGD